MISKPVMCFGELLIRLSPTEYRLLDDAARLDVHVGGAEANVGVSLANLGHCVRMISRVPDNGFGRKAIAHCRAAGVDCSDVAIAPGRMGLYFLTHGTGPRSSEVIYDRRDSTFALATSQDFDWRVLLKEAGHLHLSGITPALGQASADIALSACRTAREMSVPISFDCNYRASLWQSWQGDARAILRELVDCSDILFANHRDISLLLERPFDGASAQQQRDAAEAAFTAFPHLSLIASTIRKADSAEVNRLSARIDDRSNERVTDEIIVSGIVDRIGTGDAFAAGVLHEYLSGGDLEKMANAGLALCCLKHTIQGDSSSLRERDIQAFFSMNRDVNR